MTLFSTSGLFKDTILYSMGQVLPRLIALLLLPILSRYLSPEEYGMLGMLAILSLVATSIATLGLNWSLAKGYFSTGDRTVRDGLIWSSFLTIFFYNCLLLTLTYLMRDSLSKALLGTEEGGTYVMVAVLSVSCSGLLIPFTSYLKFEQKPMAVVCLAVLEVLAASLLTLYFVIGIGLGALGPLIAQLVAQIVLLPLFLTIAFSRIELRLSFGKEFKEALTAGMPFMFSFAGAFLLQSGTRFSLVEARGLAEGGIFVVSQSFSKILELVVMGMMTAWLPLVAKIVHDEKETVQSIRKVTASYLVLISIPVAAACFFAKPLMAILVPEPLSNGFKAIGILTMAQAFYGLYAIHQPLFVLRKKSMRQVTLEICAGVLGLILGYPLSIAWGFIGAALAQLIATILLAAGSVALLRSDLPLEYEKERFIKVIFSLLFTFCIALLQPDYQPYQWLNAFLAMAFYAAFLWRSVLKEQEREQALSWLLQVSG